MKEISTPRRRMGEPGNCRLSSQGSHSVEETSELRPEGEKQPDRKRAGVGIWAEGVTHAKALRQEGMAQRPLWQDQTDWRGRSRGRQDPGHVDSQAWRYIWVLF